MNNVKKITIAKAKDATLLKALQYVVNQESEDVRIPANVTRLLDFEELNERRRERLETFFDKNGFTHVLVKGEKAKPWGEVEEDAGEDEEAPAKKSRKATKAKPAKKARRAAKEEDESDEADPREMLRAAKRLFTGVTSAYNKLETLVENADDMSAARMTKILSAVTARLQDRLPELG